MSAPGAAAGAALTATGARAPGPSGWELLSERFAFLGNSLLDPPSHGTDLGLRERFWDVFADGLVDIGCANERIVSGVGHAQRFARRMAVDGEDALGIVRREHARLFVGPPKPAAPPWETFYARPGSIGGAGFGRATFDMRRILRQAGLEVRGASNQYADHMGLELLYVAALCGRFACAAPSEGEVAALAGFVREHPGSWAPAFGAAVKEAAPNGYYRCIAETAEGLCRCLVRDA